MCAVRVYVPATLRQLAARAPGDAATPMAEAGSLAYAVTPALREWYREGDIEELEYAAMTHAAGASLRMLAALVPREPAPRRVVLAADVPDRGVRPEPDVDTAAVRLAVPLFVTDLASLHVDDAAAASFVEAAIAALGPAAEGDDDAQFTIDELGDHELQWYGVQEIPALLEDE